MSSPSSLPFLPSSCTFTQLCKHIHIPRDDSHSLRTTNEKGRNSHQERLKLPREGRVLWTLKWIEGPLTFPSHTRLRAAPLSSSGIPPGGKQPQPSPHPAPHSTQQKGLCAEAGMGHCDSNPSSVGLYASQNDLLLASVFPPVRWVLSLACPPLRGW